jgi:hypothetical protein
MKYNCKCLICGKELITYNKTKQICPGECRKQANRLYAKEYMRKRRVEALKMVTKPCVLCNKPFESAIVNKKVICVDCEVEKLKRANPIKKYDMTNVDSEGIIYGTFEKCKDYKNVSTHL